MNETQLLTFGAAIAASFIWAIGMRRRALMVRVMGVVVLLGAWIAFRIIESA